MRMPTRASEATPPPSGRKAELNLAPRDVEGLLDELRVYHRAFSPLFQRKEQRLWSEKYLQGQMLMEVERKAIQPMARKVKGGRVQSMQQFIGQSPWDDGPILERHQRLVAETVGHPQGMLILDGCDFPKQGDDSVGVKRQWCGPLGKIANCQASVLACYASERGYTFVDKELYLPEDWFTAAYQTRWKKCGIPAGTSFQTQPELAWRMIERLHARGVLEFQWVLFDEHFGQNTALLTHLDDAGLYYFAEVPHSTRAWGRRPKTHVPLAKSKHGRTPTRMRLAPGQPKPQRVDAIAKTLRPKQWHRLTIKEGTKGPQVVEVAALRAVMVDDELPGRTEWLVFRRGLEPDAELKVFRCNAPKNTSRKTLARKTGQRWPIESTIAEGKGEVGLDHYEVRGWGGWHHHITMSFLAHHFLVRVRVRLGDQAPALTVAQARRLLNAVLPRPKFDAQAAIELIQEIQQQNRAAYRSHRKRTLRRLNKL
jgi:SRSO17 transposase